jgi:hypothetical protein
MPAPRWFERCRRCHRQWPPARVKLGQCTGCWAAGKLTEVQRAAREILKQAVAERDATEFEFQSRATPAKE